MSLEDETGMANIVVWPKVWSTYRRLARSRSLLGVDGTLQRQGDALSVLAEHFWEVPEPQRAPRTVEQQAIGALPVKARNFH